MHLRSTEVQLPKPAANMPKIIECLQEVGINHTRLVMPTRENVAALESVFEAANALVEMKKAVDRVEQEMRILKIRLGEEEEGSQVGMEVDAEPEPEVREGRAQSVVSSASRGGRVKKKVSGVMHAFAHRQLMTLPRLEGPCRSLRWKLRLRPVHERIQSDNERGDAVICLSTTHRDNNMLAFVESGCASLS